ncbi:hypothetical protein [Streptomyces sp. NPDC101166]|uniref:hypothetical protein n=1 Tax=Streptomyces sp. NPDC101166 TaxID=3366120 RepID=UPI003814DFAE
MSLKPTSAYAVRELSAAFAKDDASPDDIIDAYLFAKRHLAQSIQALILSQLPAACPEFTQLRDRIQGEMKNRYADKIPEQFLKVPYGSKTHELLFMILLRSIGKPVGSDRLRLANRDNVHTERRTRELRELGFNITTSEVDGTQAYTLLGLDIDYAKVPELIAKEIKKSSLPGGEKERLVASLTK